MATDYLLDTSTFSELIRDHPRVLSRTTSLLPAGRVSICPIVSGEILYGLERMPKGKLQRELRQRVLPLLGAVPSEPIPPDCGSIYAQIRHATEARGVSLDDNDLWIAAAALALDAVLVTCDSDFGRVRGLLIEDWTG